VRPRSLSGARGLRYARAVTEAAKVPGPRPTIAQLPPAPGSWLRAVALRLAAWRRRLAILAGRSASARPRPGEGLPLACVSGGPASTAALRRRIGREALLRSARPAGFLATERIDASAVGREPTGTAAQLMPE